MHYTNVITALVFIYIMISGVVMVQKITV